MSGEELPDRVDVSISSDADIVAARQMGRTLAARAGCGSTALTEVATAISELARNIVNYARQGTLTIRVVSDESRRGLRIDAVDHGPGIANLDQAMEDGFSTGRGLGLGLPGARRLMDEFVIDSELGRGTTVVAYKWSKNDG